MVRQVQTIELSTEVGINYIQCCSVVLMHYNEPSVAEGHTIELLTLNYTTNEQ